MIEVKAGEIRRDHHGTSWAGLNRLPRGPFEQAGDSRRALVRRLSEAVRGLVSWHADHPNLRARQRCSERSRRPTLTRSEITESSELKRHAGDYKSRGLMLDVYSHVAPALQNEVVNQRQPRSTQNRTGGFSSRT